MEVLCDRKRSENRNKILGQSDPEYNPSPKQKGALSSDTRVKNQKVKTPYEHVGYYGPYWRDGSTDPVKSIVQRAPLQHIAFEHVGYYGRWPKVAKVSSPE